MAQSRYPAAFRNISIEVRLLSAHQITDKNTLNSRTIHNKKNHVSTSETKTAIGHDCTILRTIHRSPKDFWQY